MKRKQSISPYDSRNFMTALHRSGVFFRQLLASLQFISPASLRKDWDRLESSSVKKRLLTGAFWTGLSSVGIRALGLGVSVFLARLLGKEGFGEYGMVVSTLYTFAPLATLQQAPTASVFVAASREKDPAQTARVIRQVLVITLFAGLVTGAAVFFSAPFLCQGILKDPRLLGALRWCAFLILLNALNGVLTGILSGFEAFKGQSLLSLLSGFISLPLVILGALWGGLAGVFAGMVLSQVLLNLAYLGALKTRAKRDGIKLTQGGWGPEWKKVLSFSLVNLAASLAGGPVFWLSNTLLVNQPHGYAEMGLYQAATQWHTAILTLPNVIAGISLPILAHSFGRHETFGRTVRYNLISCALISALGAGVVLILSKPILSAYGRDFGDGETVLVLMALAGVARSLFTSLNQVILSVNRIWTNLWINIGMSVLMLGLSVLWVPRGLAAGLGAAYLVSYVLTALWSAWEVKGILRTHGEAP
jgi:O-antigen/teichoic acid export membrane protein